MPLSNVAASKLVLGQKGAAEGLVQIGGWAIRATATTAPMAFTASADGNGFSAAVPSSSAAGVSSSEVVMLWAPSSGNASSKESSPTALKSPTSLESSAAVGSSVPLDIVLLPPSHLISSSSPSSFSGPAATAGHPLSFDELVAKPSAATADDATESDNATVATSALSSSSLAAAMVPRAEAALTFFRAVVRMLEDGQRQAAMRDREAALASVKAEMAKGLAEERGKQRREELMKKHQQMAAYAGSEGGGGSGLRVKTEDAIRYLMGKETREDVLRRAEQQQQQKEAERASRTAAKSRLLAANAQQQQRRPNGNDNAHDGANSGSGGQWGMTVGDAISRLTAASGGANDFDSDWSDD